MTGDRLTLASDSALAGAAVRWFDEYASDGIVTTDTALVVRSWNRWLVLATGLHASQAIGRALTDLFPSIRDSGLELYYAAALAGEVKVVSHTLHRFIFPATRTSRERMIQSGRIAPLYEDGVVVGTITVVEDVSERVASERELRAQIATAEAARLAAEEASRVKDEFLATLSHEIRTPLSAVLGWTRILRSRDELDEATVRRAIEVIDRNAMAQLTLISDMLDMARIAAGKMRIDARPVDLVAVAMAAIDVVRPGADTKGVQLIPRLSPLVPPVLGDADRLQQVIWNLLSNAIKFTDSGGEVVVTLDGSGSNVRLVVSDTGHGISREFLPQIFQRFKQAEGASSRRYGGLGLGLALVTELVSLHRGTVSAESEGVGRGAAFTVLLPIHTDTVRSEQLSQVEILPGDSQHLAGIRVLVVEDDPDAREILARTMTDAGGSVVITSSSAEALTSLRGGPQLPHIVVTDIGMPTSDGYSFLEALRREPAWNSTALPVVALTAFATTADRTKALASGFAAHLGKPFSPALLVQTIAKFARANDR